MSSKVMSNEEIIEKVETAMMLILEPSINLVKDSLANKYSDNNGIKKYIDTILGRILEEIKITIKDFDDMLYEMFAKLYGYDCNSNSKYFLQYIKIYLSYIVSEACADEVMGYTQYPPTEYIQEICSKLVYEINNITEINNSAIDM